MSHILLVEDDPLCARVVAGTLKRAGHSVVTLDNAADALQALRGDHFGLVISDVLMPGGLSGFELVESIRKNVRTSKIPIAFLTGLGKSEDVKRALACGVDDYMVKPADPDILIAKVASLLERDLGANLMQREIHEIAQIAVEIAIISISDTGLTLVFPFAIEPGKKFKLRGQLLDAIGLGTTTLNVLTCHHHAQQPDRHVVETSFVDLTDAKMKLIRLWFNRNREA